MHIHKITAIVNIVKSIKIGVNDGGWVLVGSPVKKSSSGSSIVLSILLVFDINFSCQYSFSFLMVNFDVTWSNGKISFSTSDTGEKDLARNEVTGL